MNASPERVDLAGLVLEVGNVVAEDSEASVDLLHSISLAGVPEIIVKIVETFYNEKSNVLPPGNRWRLRLLDAVVVLDERDARLSGGHHQRLGLGRRGGRGRGLL